MPNQKFENLLNLSLNVSENERMRSQALNTGYSPLLKSWELIVKYHGNLEKLESDVIHIEPLINNYAIVTIREDFLDAFGELDEIEYVEKPKRLYYE